MMDTLLSLDVGTTTAKGVLFDVEGNELASTESAFTLSTPHRDWVEQDPEHIWQAVVKVLSEISKNHVSTCNILSIGLATQGGSTLPATWDGTPTWPAITWMDQRSGELVAQWKADGTADFIRSHSGWTPEPGLPLPVIAWFRDNQPDMFAQTKRWLSINDFLTHRLCGQFAMNPSMAGEMLLMNIQKNDWDPELCALAGITEHHLSPIYSSEVVIGQVTAKTARQTGLPAGTPIIAGGQDHSCEALAIGMTTEGKSLLACGTAWVLNGVSADADMSSIPECMNLNCHVIPNCWTISQFLGGLGASYEWWITRSWGSVDAQQRANRRNIYIEFNRILGETTPDCRGLKFLPLTGGQHQTGADHRGGFVGLKLHHTSADMGRAILESAAYELNMALEQLSNSGMPIDQLWMIGGATRSPIWPQIIADVTGVEILLTQYSHGPALGAAMLAGLGVGAFNSFEECSNVFKVTASQIHPDLTTASLYQSSFNSYKQASNLLKQLK